MSVNPRWSYVQARLQARHGERLQEADWRSLEAARSLDQFIERARATSLRRFAQRLNAGMSSHAIERSLRAAWRDYVEEVAGWGPAEWRPAALWTSHFPDLPAIDALLRGDRPDWALQEANLAVFTIDKSRAGDLKKSLLAPLMPAPERENTVPGRWLAQWRSRLPRGPTQPALDALADAIKMHAERLGRADRQETSGPYRRALMRSVTRMFRRHGGSPVAMFCHLALVALDLERLRGGLVRRRLFQPAATKEAA
jgi:hypothetical protein